MCRGLFQAHRLIFSFLICTSIQRQAQHITPAEWSYLLRGAQPSPTTRPNPAPTVLTPASWGGLHALEEVLPVFKGIVRSFVLEGQAWIQWLQSPEPHLKDLPASWQSEVIFLCFTTSPTRCVCLCVCLWSVAICLSVCLSACSCVSVCACVCISACVHTIFLPADPPAQPPALLPYPSAPPSLLQSHHPCLQPSLPPFMSHGTHTSLPAASHHCHGP